MYQFFTPWFALLLPLPFIAIFLFPPKNKSEVNTLYFPALKRLQAAFEKTPTQPNKQSRLFFSLLSLAWLCLVIAMMQPEKVDQHTLIHHKGYDIMLAVDTSGSMKAVDFSTTTQPVSRLDATKEVVSKFVKGRQGDRVGLITFGEKAFLHVPLTLDTLSVSKMLKGIESGMAGNATSIGDAIGMGVKTLRERPEGSRVLVLLTDGEDNASKIPPLEAAKLAQQYGIKIYTIGVGKKGPVPFPNGFGGYAMAEMPLDEDMLQKIADSTGGQYFLATNPKALESIYTKINQLEKSEANETLYQVREPFYIYPLLLASVFLLLLSLTQIFRRRAVLGS